jgi:hypothetical protein
MKLIGCTGPLQARVQRRFETNRLAREFQAQAYQEAMPLVRRPRTAAAAPIQVDVALLETGVLAQGGVAA